MIGHKNYVGRDKNQRTTPSCARHAVTHALTQWYYERYGVVKEFSVDSILKNRLPHHPHHEAFAITYALEVIKKNGVSEEHNNNSLEHCINFGMRPITDRDDLEDTLTRQGLVIGSIGGLDLVTKEGHALFLIRIDNLNPPYTMCDFVFQGSWGNGEQVFKNVDINGFMQGHMLHGKVQENSFSEMYLKEEYIRQEWQINDNYYTVNGRRRYSDMAPFLQSVPDEDARTVVPLRAFAEAFGCEVIWNDGKITVVNKPQER